jgi:hypothetical protein
MGKSQKVGNVPNAPAFYAHMGSTQSVSNNSFTKLQVDTETYDTASAFDSTTNYRFTPQVAGYYQVNGRIAFSTAASGVAILSVHKNGSEHLRGGQIALDANQFSGLTVAGVVYLNGSTDYIELFGFQNSGGSLTVANAGSVTDYFQACLVRPA